MRSSVQLIILTLTLFACGKSQESKTTDESSRISVPRFSSDSAYSFVAKQVSYGPRVPGSKAHIETGDYLIRQLKKYGASVTVQNFEADSYDGHHLSLRNIIASFNPDKPKRVLLAAHWDTRPFADKDSLKKDAPFDGANDGASGTGILLEIARMMQKTPPSIGVDIIFFDGEDWGEKNKDVKKTELSMGLDSWWCLGSQYWVKHRSNYRAYYGILLDMAGAKGAHFVKEGISMQYAPKVVEKVWKTAERLGYGSLFVDQEHDGIQDDHVFVNEYASIPMIDIVDYQPGIGYFGDYHHSTKDNMDLIGKETLAAVGIVVLEVIYSE